MRSPERFFTPLWLSCLFLAVFGPSAWGQVSGQITGVRLEPENRRIVIESRGKVGEHTARVIARPNRLILDFNQTGIAQIPGKISVSDPNIKEFRVGFQGQRARVVADFQNKQIPPYQVKRVDNAVLVIFGKSVAAHESPNSEEFDDVHHQEAAVPSFLTPATAAGTHPTMDSAHPNTFADHTYAPAPANVQPAMHQNMGAKPSGPTTAKANTGWTVGTWTGTAAAAPTAGGQRRVAQSLEFNTPSSTIRDRRQGGGSVGIPAMGRPQGAPAGNQSGMPREVRPPVTPPTPDPRLLVQEITELKFIQVGHNSRLIIRGGDHLDYRLNNVSPTKVRVDLINAEIPKLYQKPLRTDQWSTSVEMIVPGSQTIFVQLKDSVPFQTEKQKGVLMMDFPPPRFALSHDQKKAGTSSGGGDAAAREAMKQSREERRQAMEAIREQEIIKDNELRRKGIESLRAQQDELIKQQGEIQKRYRATPDPQIFQKPVSMDFQGIALKNAFRLLAEQAGINIIVDDKVTGSTTLRLFQVPLGQVLDTILNSHDLDREMVGNVMRIGNKKSIGELKKARKDEYDTRMAEVNERLKQITEDIKAKEEKIQEARKELEKTTAQQPEEVQEEVKFEDVGEAGCIKIGNRDVCFQFVNIRLLYADPVSVSRTLKCLFNFECGKAGAAAVSDSVVGRAEAKARQDSESEGLLGPAQQLAVNQTIAAYGTASQGLAQMGGAVGGGAPVGGVPGASEVAAAEGLMGSVGRKFATGTMDVDLQKIIDNSMVYADQKTKSIYIKDTPDRISSMKKVIYQLDVPEPQVTIEGRLVEASKSWGRALGILWGGRNNQTGPLTDNRTSYWGLTGAQGSGSANTATGQQTNGNNIPSSFAVNLPATLTGAQNPLSAIGVQFGLLATQYITELDYRIQMGEMTGQTKTISRPKVTVLNKQKGSIKNGKQIPYQSVGAAGAQTTMVNADLQLEVTPEIFADGRIRMEVKFTNNEPDETYNPPAITTREAKSIMDVKDGQTAVIGGIIKSTNAATRQGWPGLMNVPVVNWLFSNKSSSDNLSEILVFITPVIVKRPPPAS